MSMKLTIKELRKMIREEVRKIQLLELTNKSKSTQTKNETKKTLKDCDCE